MRGCHASISGRNKIHERGESDDQAILAGVFRFVVRLASGLRERTGAGASSATGAGCRGQTETKAEARPALASAHAG